MRVIVIKQATDLKTLGDTLLPAVGVADRQAALSRIAVLNPHVDFQRIVAGTVLVAPDLRGLNTAGAQPAGGDTFAQLSADLNAGLKGAVQRANAAVDAITIERKAVDAALKLAAAKRAIESDPILKQQLAAASVQSQSERKAAQDDVKAAEEMAKQAAEELAALGKLLG